jgi:Inhibitor of vertebrate lysozyme (Ivy)
VAERKKLRCGVGPDKATAPTPQLASTKPCMLEAINQRIAELEALERQGGDPAPTHEAQSEEAVRAAFGKKIASDKWDNIKLRKTVIANGYARQDWAGDNTGGEAILKYTPDGWVVLKSTGGALSIDEIVKVGVPRETAAGLASYIPAARQDVRPVQAHGQAAPTSMRLTSQLGELYPEALATLQRAIPERLKSVPWVYALKGNDGPLKDIDVRGRPSLYGSVCKPHDCADNRIAFVIAADGSRAVAIILEDGKAIKIGGPSVEEISFLLKEEPNLLRAFSAQPSPVATPSTPATQGVNVLPGLRAVKWDVNCNNFMSPWGHSILTFDPAELNFLLDQEKIRAFLRTIQRSTPARCGFELNSITAIVNDEAGNTRFRASIDGSEGPNRWRVHENYVVAEAAERTKAQTRENKRREFISQTGLAQIVRMEDLKGNPFIFKDKKVGVLTSFIQMTSEHEGLFMQYGFASSRGLFVSNLPSTLFQANQQVLLVIKVLGIKQEVGLPHGEYVGQYWCQQLDCKDFLN